MYIGGGKNIKMETKTHTNSNHQSSQTNKLMKKLNHISSHNTMLVRIGERNKTIEIKHINSGFANMCSGGVNTKLT